MKRVLLVIFFLGFFLGQASALTEITATGGWTETIDAADLISGAGSDLTSTYESASNATDLDITSIRFWRVDVDRSDTTWHGDFTLSVRRTSDGSGSGTISGGLAYMEITTTTTQFFSGTFNRTDVTTQYQLTGMSVDVPPDTYTTTVTYTVVDL
jgi:hypothetical protein